MSSNKDYRPIPTEEAASSSTSTSNHPSSHSHPHSSSSTFNSYKPHPSIKQTFLSYIALIFCSSFILFSLFLSFFSSSNPIHLSKGQRPPLKPIERNDLTWNDEKCRKEFPAFYPQLEQNARAWRFKGGITKDQVQRAKDGNSQRWGYARVIIKDGQLFIRNMREAGDSRISALLHILHKSISSTPISDPNHKPLPPIDMVFTSADKEGIDPSAKAGWAIDKRVDEPLEVGTWLMPDFGFSGWPEAGIPSFPEFISLASQEEESYPWLKKDDRAFWRGYANHYPSRLDLLEKTDSKTNSSRSEWSDVRQTTFHNDVGDFGEIVPMYEHCRRRYLIHSEGNSYSGRSKYLFSCNSVTIAHKLEWTQHFHAALDSNPQSINQNFIELPGKLFENLELGVRELWKSDGIQTPFTSSIDSSSYKVLGKNSAKQIADSASRILRDRYLTPTATSCYMRAALRFYSDVMVHSTWGSDGVTLEKGNGVKPDSGRGKDLKGMGVVGDVEYGVWTLLGSPEWNP